jgi:hypothetical protein
MSRGLAGALLSLTLALGCASAADKPDPAPAPPAVAVDEPDDDEDEDEGPTLPRTLDEAAALLEFTCPVPTHSYDTPARVEVGGETVVLRGSDAVRETDGAADGVVLGVLGALKDAGDETRANVKKAAELFGKRGVQVVVVNGDLGEDEALEDVFRILGESFDRPVFVHSGNMEWTSAFSKSWEAARKDHPHVINANWLEQVDLGGGMHLLVLPGYFNLRFMRSGTCRYTDETIDRLKARADKLKAAGATVALVSHGPPLGKGQKALDVAYDEAGNVGDERLTAMIEGSGIRFGLFSHILESGGRACADPECKTPLTLPVRQPSERLYVNAGSASGYGWELLDGTQSSGMAMVVKMSASGATAELLKLR